MWLSIGRYPLRLCGVFLVFAARLLSAVSLLSTLLFSWTAATIMHCYANRVRHKANPHGIIALACSFMLLASCASSPGLHVIGSGQTVSIRSANLASSTATASVSNQVIKRDAGVGAGTGALAGAAWGLACGPLFWFCSPLGALAGGASGGVAGMLVGAVESLPPAMSSALKQKISDYLTLHDLENDMLTSLKQRAASRWHLVEGEADTTILLRVESMGLNSHRKQQITLLMNVTLEVNYRSKSGKPVKKQRSFDYESSDSPAQIWLEDPDDFVAKRFTEALSTLTENILADLSM